MTSLRLSPVAAGIALAAAARSVSLAPPVSAITTTTLYANPQGTGSACNKVDPCSVGTAFSTAATGDNVAVEPGTYTETSTLQLVASGVHVSGVSGSAAPTINSSAPVGVEITHGS